MTSILQALKKRWDGLGYPFLVAGETQLYMSEVQAQDASHLNDVQQGEVVALIGDFNIQSIADLLTLIDRKAVLVPLTTDTRGDHEYFFENALVDWVVEDGSASRRDHSGSHDLLTKLRQRGHPGLVLFSTGTTGRPKAILHDMTVFLERFDTPRPALRTLAFLLFDHIGGINTLLHTLFNTGVIISPAGRSIQSVLATCQRHDVEVLPTTPTFLRMMLMSGLIPEGVPDCLRIVTYGTERMDQSTLDQLCDLLPRIDFRQTFGMSELGILRVKSKARNSLFMRIGGEGVRIRVDDDVLKIFSPTRMMGYLNAISPFDDYGWYNTHDVVETDGEYIKVVGRTHDVINVAGLKFMSSEVERVALRYQNIRLATVTPRDNPVTGQHVELIVEAKQGTTLDLDDFRAFLNHHLPSHKMPRRIRQAKVDVNHRFKKA